jgi:hypothetical protein
MKHAKNACAFAEQGGKGKLKNQGPVPEDEILRSPFAASG